MSTAIPTHLIAGPLGAGKTSLLRHLLSQRPADERWAILINEFGLIGLDAALLSRDEDGLSISEVAGGCVCCVNGVPFQVGLGRLIRRARPDRLFIEPSGLGHPAELLQQLAQAPWTDVLAVQPLVLVLDAAALQRGDPLPESQRAVLQNAGLLLLNKSEGLDDEARALLQRDLPSQALWTSQGELPLARLPRSLVQTSTSTATLPDGKAGLPQIWRHIEEPICQVQRQLNAWSIGWRWHPSQRFDLTRVQSWLAGLDWQRAKLIVQSRDGWSSANALHGQALQWQASDWRKDSRLELIFSEAQDEAVLQADMTACRL